MTPIRTALAATLLALLAAGPASAQELIYQCSGIGFDQREAANQAQYTVKIVYAQPDGHYLGGAQTTVRDSAGTELVSVKCPGPWVLLNLPTGRYKITATLDGKTQSRNVAVSAGKRQKQVFRF